MRKISNTFKTGILGCTLALAGFSAAHAGGFKVIHYFAGGSGDGALPNEVLPLDSNHLYLTTYEGGANGAGTVSLVHKDGSVIVLHSFGADADDGKFPAGPLLAYDDHLYGTTSAGGFRSWGTIFSSGLDVGSYDVRYEFGTDGDSDGREPTGGFELDGEVLFSTTRVGGAYNYGTLFQWGGGDDILADHDFDKEDGANPYANIVRLAATGALYETTAAGGAYNLGTVVESDIIHGRTYVLHSFAGNGDGANPEGTLVEENGTYYGTTTYGGSDGLGTIFKVNTDGTGYSMLYSFKGVCCGRSDGSFPVGGLVLRNSELYGTTINGGSASDLGIVFKFDPNTGVETVLHAFTGADGAHPYARVAILGKKLYGTTNGGGPHNQGVLFKMPVE
jgi:uncharacterized repeat protein (TIGR03803 family)